MSGPKSEKCAECGGAGCANCEPCFDCDGCPRCHRPQPAERPDTPAVEPERRSFLEKVVDDVNAKFTPAVHTDTNTSVEGIALPVRYDGEHNGYIRDTEGRIVAEISAWQYNWPAQGGKPTDEITPAHGHAVGQQIANALNATAEASDLRAIEWTPVSEGLPTEDGMYNVTFFGGGRWIVDTLRFADGEWVENARLIEAWLPIPQYKSAIQGESAIQEGE